MSAPPWVLLRGLTREAAHWGEFVPALQARSSAPVICLDLPGAGLRHRDTSPARLEALTDACRAALRNGVGDVVIANGREMSFAALVTASKPLSGCTQVVR